MKPRLLILLLYTVLALPLVADREVRDDVIATSLVRVVANPEEYNGKRILLKGFQVLSTDRSSAEGELGPLRVELQPYPEERAVFHHNPVILRFMNAGSRPVKMLRPLDGSEWSWHMPYYRFTVTDMAGNEVEMLTRCGISGLWANLEWPDDYLIQILPGDVYEMRVGLYHAIPEEGDYRVTFEYVYDPEVDSRSGIIYPENLWIGTARSREIILPLRESL